MVFENLFPFLFLKEWNQYLISFLVFELVQESYMR